jgi:hypothetical protein
MAGEGIVPQPGISPYGEMQDWGNGMWMARREINAHWAEYAPVNEDGSRIVDEDGTLRRGVAILRHPIISDEVIVEAEARWAIEEGRAEAV